MAKITYRFIKNHPDMIIRKLDFEADGTGITENVGSVIRDITGLLDIDILVEGGIEAVGSGWSLIVKVNDNPLITADGTGVIRGAIGRNQTSHSYGAYSWF